MIYYYKATITEWVIHMNLDSIMFYPCKLQLNCWNSISTILLHTHIYTCIDPLQIRPSYGHILGGVPVLVSGPPFKQDSEIKVSFDDIMVNCIYVNIDDALCISPFFTKTGRVTVTLHYNTYDKTTTFYSSELMSS